MTARSDDDLRAVNDRLRARIAELQGQIAELETECLVLRDARDSARAAVAAEQRSHQEYRLRNPARRAS